MSTDVDGFADLFQGNPNAYGTVEGGCVRAAPDFAAHLEHPSSSIGIYPMVESAAERVHFKAEHDVDGGAWYVRWGCTDIDNKADPESCWPLARNLVKALAALGLAAHVERTKGKGYHVWVFASDWVPAIVMRRALLAAHQVAGVAPTEVNPKQVDTTGIKAGLGNYVNLPYAADREAGRRCVVDDSGFEVPLDDFLEAAYANLASFDRLVSAAKLYIAPPKVQAVSYTEPKADAAELAKALKGLAFTIWKNGPLEGRDRSGTLGRMCHLMAEQALPPGEAMVLLRDADCRWGKFFDRSDCDLQLGKLIEVAYTKQR
jgi:hypothetical protein